PGRTPARSASSATSSSSYYPRHRRLSSALRRAGPTSAVPQSVSRPPSSFMSRICSVPSREASGARVIVRTVWVLRRNHILRPSCRDPVPAHGRHVDAQCPQLLERVHELPLELDLPVLELERVNEVVLVIAGRIAGEQNLPLAVALHPEPVRVLGGIDLD